MASVAVSHPLVVAPLSLETLRPLLEPQTPPCLSLYLPTHRNVPDNTVDQLAFRHLVESLEMALSLSNPRHSIERLLRPFRGLVDDRHMWQHTREGLAVLATDGKAHVFHLPRPVQPLAVVTPRFHTLPLVRIVTAIDRFHVLALDSREGHIFEGLYAEPGAAVQRLDPVPLDTGEGPASRGVIPRSDAVDAEIFQPHRVQRGIGPSGLGPGSIVHGGFGAKQDDIDADTEIFFRYVDAMIHERVSKRTGLPLVLVALPALAAVFRGLTKNRMLLDDIVPKDPKLLSTDDLAALVAPIFATARQRRVAHAINTFKQARNRDLAASDLSDIARAAVAGRVAMLLIESDRFEPGHFDRTTGAIDIDGPPPPDLSRNGDQPAMQSEDLLSAVAEAVLLNGGGIMSLDRNAMPTESGAAAIYRY